MFAIKKNISLNKKESQKVQVSQKMLIGQLKKLKDSILLRPAYFTRNLFLAKTVSRVVKGGSRKIDSFIGMEYYDITRVNLLKRR